MKITRYRWWHGLAFYAGVQVVQWGLRTAARRLMDTQEDGSHKNDRKSYAAQRLPIFAPPGAAFPIAWSINCASTIAGGLYVLNLPVETEGRAEFLRLQAIAWSLFALFETAYFGFRSPINAALVTFAYTGVTAASLDVALRRMEDLPAALSLATTLVWLALANPVAVAQAAWNQDPFWNAGPFAAPPQGWEKTAHS